MDWEAMEFDHEEVTELEMPLASLRLEPPALPSAATRRPRTTPRIRSRRFSRLARPYPPPALAFLGLSASGLDDLIAASTAIFEHPPPEFEFVMPTMPSIDHARHGVPSSAGGTVPPTLPATPVRRQTARTRPRVVKFRSAYWVRIALSRLSMDPLPPSVSTSTPANRAGSGAHELAHHAKR